jgi:hypothetical protein
MNRSSLAFIVTLLIVTVYVRFLGIAGLDFALHGKTLSAYLASSTRALIFLIQFVGVIYLAIKCFEPNPPSSETKYISAALLFLVSTARYFLPIFLVTIVGDLMVIWWLKRRVKVVRK